MHKVRRRLNPTYAIGLLVIGIGLLGFFLNRAGYIGGSDPSRGSNLQNTNEPRTGSAQVPAAIANLPQQAQDNQAPAANVGTDVQAERLNVTIQGVIKNPDGQPVPNAVVVLYKDSQKGADPRFADESGTFQFPALPLRKSNKYTLQVKAPALSGEYAFTSDHADPTTHNINANITLTASPGLPSPPPPDEDLARTVRDAMRDIRDILLTISHSFNYIVLLVGLLALISLAVCVGVVTSLALIALSSRQFSRLVAEHEKVNTTLEKVFLRDDINKTLQTVSDELNKTVQTVSEDLNKAVQTGSEDLNKTVQTVSEDLNKTLRTISAAIREIPNHSQQQNALDQGNQYADPAIEPKQEEVPSNVGEPTVEEPTVEEPTVEEPGVGLTASLSEQLEDIPSGTAIDESEEKAIAAYRNLLSGLQPVPPPRYLKIDRNCAYGSELEQVKIYLVVNAARYSPFVLFPQTSSRGWLFPNPETNYIEDMSRVFLNLTREQFSDDKYNLRPIEAQTASPDVWQVVP